mmetsp:Transcript_48602/g.128878  ORF Transcript_48602/g.128878 Transcript_48602/m.128878 type:complete len:207 (+) Transcript_48602:848-1468(+)
MPPETMWPLPSTMQSTDSMMSTYTSFEAYTTFCLRHHTSEEAPPICVCVLVPSAVLMASRAPPFGSGTSESTLVLPATTCTTLPSAEGGAMMDSKLFSSVVKGRPLSIISSSNKYTVEKLVRKLSSLTSPRYLVSTRCTRSSNSKTARGGCSRDTTAKNIIFSRRTWINACRLLALMTPGISSKRSDARKLSKRGSHIWRFVVPRK